MPPNHFESEVESFLEGSHGDRTHIKRADHHTVTPLCGTLLAPLLRRASEGLEGLAAVPVGGGRAWPGFEATRRAKLAARTARGRAAAHGHTKQPGPTARPSGPSTPAALVVL